jgi:hypothetical protein
MKKRRQTHTYYRKIKTHQEIVANDEIKDDGNRERWGRKRRSKKTLDPWVLEKQHHFQKNWKRRSKDKKQYFGRGQKHIYFLKIDNDFRYHYKEWNFREYCNRNGIPYKVVRVYVSRKSSTEYKYKVLVKIQLTWWADKDIGIEYILRKKN